MSANESLTVWQNGESVVAFVRAMMERFPDCVCDGSDDEGCDACAFDRLFSALPHSLRIAAIRYQPTAVVRRRPSGNAPSEEKA